MTSLEKALKDREISFYKVAKFMGKNTNSGTTYYFYRIKGNVKMKYTDLQQICEKVTELTPDNPLNISDLQFEVSNVVIK